MNITIIDETRDNKLSFHKLTIIDVDSIECSVMKDDTNYRTVKFKAFGMVLKNCCRYRFHKLFEDEHAAVAFCTSLNDAKDDVLVSCVMENMEKI